MKLPEPAYKLRSKVRHVFAASLDVYTEAQMRQAIRDALDEVLNCYSPDDTVTDYQDKIKAMKETI